MSNFDIIKKSPFLRSIFLLTSGSIIAQGIRALGTLGVTRLYSPEVMGTYSYLISISAIFMGIANFRYDVSIVTDPDNNHVYPLIKLSGIIGIVVAILSSFGFGFYFAIVGKPVYWAVLIFLNVIAYALVNVLTAYNNRQKEYKLISSMYVLRTSTQYSLAILLGLIHPLAICLLVPYVLGEYMGLSRQFKSLKPHINKVFKSSIEDIKEVAIIHKKQPFYSMPALLANSLSYSLITIFIENLYGLETVGYYSISVTLLGIPLAVIGTNISKVFIQRASEEYSKNGTYKLSFNRTFLILLSLAIPMIVIMILFATPLCTFLFGREWGASGVFIKILAPMFGIRFITSALTPAMIIVKKQQVELFLQGIFLISNLISFFIAKTQHLGVEGFLGYVSLLFTLSYALYLLLIFIYSRKQIHNEI